MRSRWLALAAGMLAIAAPFVLAACGGDDDSSGNEVDRAFVAGMIPHHQLAIEMAEVARERAQSQFVRDLADDIISAQASEIRAMRSADAELPTRASRWAISASPSTSPGWRRTWPRSNPRARSIARSST
jgi:predicted outer membrane protein